jgi:Glycosyltransferase family 87
VRYRYPAYVGAGIAASALAALLGYAQKLPCSSGGAWNTTTGQFRDSCYTDIYPLYYNEQLAAGKVPYFGHPVEYPVLIGAMMQVAAWVVHSVSDPYSRGKDFYYVTVVMLAVCLLVGVLATAATADRERGGAGWARGGAGWAGGGAGWKAALLVALSPALILAAFINWDLFAMALAAGGFAAWAAQRHYLAGVLLALAVATKFYPLLFFGALLLLCLRAGKMREFGKAFGAGVVAWLVVNLPVAIPATAGWARFYAFSRDRGADWGSVWYLFEHYNVPVLGDSTQSALNWLSSGSFAIACVAIAVLALAAPRRPRLPQLCFLVLAAFLILNKVWSPQYVIWLVPLAVLSRPRIWSYVLWQVAEVAYFFGIWGYFVNLYQAPSGITANWYFVILAARLLTVGVLAGTMVIDMLHPERDRVRASGLNDDPAGGVLDGAPDRLVIVWGRDRDRGTPEPAEAAANLPARPLAPAPKPDPQARPPSPTHNEPNARLGRQERAQLRTWHSRDWRSP